MMLSIKPIQSAIGAAKYFTQEDSYYSHESKVLSAKELSIWWGKGAEALDLSGKSVEEKTLQMLCEGKLSNEEMSADKRQGIKHRAGLDLTFSAPKSVSILAFLSEDKRFYEAHKQAVTEALTMIEHDCAQARVLKEGGMTFENTGKLVIARMEHGTSRELDPFMHTHCLVMNLTQREDGAWRALASCKKQQMPTINGFREKLYHHQIYYGLLYRSSLAHSLKQMGFELENVGPHGMWEIKNMPQEVRETFSKRRRQIESELENREGFSYKMADVITQASRKRKSKHLDFSVLKKAWEKELNTLNFSVTDFLKAHGTVEKTNSMTLSQSQPMKINIREDAGKSTEKPLEAGKVIEAAVEHLSSFHLRLTYQDIIEKGMTFSMGVCTHEEIVHAADRLIETQQLIPLNPSESVFVT